MYLKSYIQGNHYLNWRDEDHRLAYLTAVRDLEGAEGPYTKPILYLLTSCETTREHIWDILDFRTPHDVVYGCWNEPWNTPESRMIIALVSMINEETFAEKAARGTLAAPFLDAMEWAAELHEIIGEPFDPVSIGGELI